MARKRSRGGKPRVITRIPLGFDPALAHRAEPPPLPGEPVSRREALAYMASIPLAFGATGAAVRAMFGETRPEAQRGSKKAKPATATTTENAGSRAAAKTGSALQPRERPEPKGGYWVPGAEFTGSTHVGWDGSDYETVRHVVQTELEHRNSPAAGASDLVVKACKGYGVHPYYLLAKFRMESNWGKKGIGARNNSWGNIEYSSQRPEGIKYESDGKRFRKYPDWHQGGRDLTRLLRERYVDRGLSSVDKITPVYAPAKENDVSKYKNVVIDYMNELGRTHLMHKTLRRWLPTRWRVGLAK